MEFELGEIPAALLPPPLPPPRAESPMATEACARRQAGDDTGGGSEFKGGRIPEGGGRVPCLCKAILDFHVTRLPLKGLAV